MEGLQRHVSMCASASVVAVVAVMLHSFLDVDGCIQCVLCTLRLLPSRSFASLFFARVLSLVSTVCMHTRSLCIVSLITCTL